MTFQTAYVQPTYTQRPAPGFSTYPTPTSATSSSAATYTVNQRYQAANTTPVNSFSYGIPTPYSPAHVATFESPVQVNIPVHRYLNWWSEYTTVERRLA